MNDQTESPEAVFRRQIAGLTGPGFFVRRGDIRHLVRDLKALLKAIRKSIGDPTVGVALISDVFNLDDSLYGRCDDSDGGLGDFFKKTVTDAWVAFAKQYPDSAKLRDIYWELVFNNEYSTRDRLMDFAAEVLPEAEVRNLIDRAWQVFPDRSDDFSQVLLQLCGGNWARQLRDAELFEKIYLNDKAKPTDYDYFKMAECRLDCGHIEAAVAWLEKVPKPGLAHQEIAQALWLRVHGARGNTDKAQAVLAEQFRAEPRRTSFDRWAALFDEKDRDDLLSTEVARMKAGTTWNSQDVFFMWELDLDEDVVAYILERWDRVPGSEYGWLPGLARDLARKGHRLAACVVYRALLQSMLRRKVARAYDQGADYLKKMDVLSARIADWGPMPTHAVFLAELKAQHGLKRSFWQAYSGEGGSKPAAKQRRRR